MGPEAQQTRDRIDLTPQDATLIVEFLRTYGYQDVNVQEVHELASIVQERGKADDPLGGFIHGWMCGKGLFPSGTDNRGGGSPQV